MPLTPSNKLDLQNYCFPELFVKVLVVDDELSILFGIKKCLKEYDVTTIENPLTALELAKTESFNIILTDYKMPGINGIEFLKRIRICNPDCIAMLITAFADKEILEEAINDNLIMKVMDKPVRLDELKIAVDDAAALFQQLTAEKQRITHLENDLTELKNRYESKTKVIGLDKGLAEIYKKTEQIAQFPVNVLITGETGTGKEVFADLIHNSSPRKDRACIKINCAAIPESLLEGELFGYKKGAFTGAVKDKAGKIAMADGGTLFLDEIGDLKPDLQAKLLRVIQEKKVTPLGDTQSRDVDFRLICATHVNLKEAVNTKNFREDLYYRLSHFPISLPALRERLEDMEDLVNYFIGKSCFDMKIPVKRVAPEVIDFLKTYDWPGNLRQLENAVVRAVVLSFDREEIDTTDFALLFEGSENEQYQRGINILASTLLNTDKDLKKIEKDILSSVLKLCEGKVYTAVELTGIAKDKFYRINKKKIN